MPGKNNPAKSAVQEDWVTVGTIGLLFLYFWFCYLVKRDTDTLP